MIETTAFNQTYIPIVGFPLPGKFKSKDIAWIDLSKDNEFLSNLKTLDTETLGDFVNGQIENQKSKIGIGGYGEHRTVYQKFKHFGEQKNAREIHLGVDIWAPHKTAVVAPLPGRVHGMANNDNKGDYGPTIILEHLVGNTCFYTLYGHLSKKSLQKVEVGDIVERGTRIGSLGKASENGGWPPHLHFQIVLDLEKNEGDYPGVCTKKDAPNYLKNCPDPIAFFKHSWSDFIPKRK